MKCTPEEAHELAGKVGRAFAEDANMLNLALLIDLAREPLQAKIDALMQAIRQTLDDNGHLADGENCTLIVLKRALRKIGVPWKDDESAEIRAGIEP